MLPCWLFLVAFNIPEIVCLLFSVVYADTLNEKKLKRQQCRKIWSGKKKISTYILYNAYSSLKQRNVCTLGISGKC